MRIDGSRDTLNPGLLRQRVTIQQKSVTGQDTRGQDEYTWASVQETWANITALQGREMEVVQQRWADARFKVIMHFLAGVTFAMRLAWLDGSTTRILQIMDVQDPDGLRKRLVLFCREWAT